MKLSEIPTLQRESEGSRRSRAVAWLTPSGRARQIGLALSALVLIGATVQAAVGWNSSLPGDVVFRSGETVVDQSEYQRRVAVLEALYGIRAPESGTERDSFRKDAAKAIAVSVILDDAAAEDDVVVSSDEVQTALNKLIEEQLPEGREAFVAYLDTQGLPERDVLDELRRQLITTRLFTKVTASVTPVTDAEVRAAFEERQEEMVSPEQRRLRNIVVETEQAAEQIKKTVRSGGDFRALAKKYSLDQSTRDAGGDLGTISADQLDKTYADAAFVARPGSVFGPVQTQYGWNVGQVVGVVPARPLSFADAAEQLEAELNSERKVERWRSWLARRMKAVKVEYADRYRPADPDAPPSSAPRTDAPELGK